MICQLLMMLVAGNAPAAVPPFNAYPGVVAYQPVVDIVPSGTMLNVQPTVSADRKYVTLSMQPRQSQLIRLQNFPVIAGAGGVVGGGTPAAVVPGIAPASINASAPVKISDVQSGSALRQTGMMKVAGLR